MNKKIKMTRRIFCLLLSFALCFQVFFPLFSLNISAEDTSSKSISTSDPLDDLMGSVIDGKDFNLSSYGFNVLGSADVITLAESGYSTDSDRLDEYELYVYVYNPRGLNIEKYATGNCITMRFGGDTSDSFSKFGLEFVSSSTQSSYEGLFYKFRVSLGSASKRSIWESLSASKRVYEIGEIELMVSGNSTVDIYDVGKIFSYSGYSAGYGDNVNDESTLSCTSGNSKTLSLDVHSTYYRPEGTQSGSVSTQDTLHSVYFSVPNEYIEKYGEMTAVHARWLDAVLKPALVSGNLNAHNAILPYTGVSVGDTTPELGYAYVGNLTVTGTGTNGASYTGGYVYNHPFEDFTSGFTPFLYSYSERIDALYMVFNAYTGEDNSADTYSIPSEVILSKLNSGYDVFGGDLVNGKYSSLFFESVADKFTDMNIQSTIEYKLTSSVISQEWWQKLFGLSTVTETEYDGIKAIYAVSEADFSGNDIAGVKLR